MPRPEKIRLLPSSQRVEGLLTSPFRTIVNPILRSHLDTVAERIGEMEFPLTDDAIPARLAAVLKTPRTIIADVMREVTEQDLILPSRMDVDPQTGEPFDLYDRDDVLLLSSFVWAYKTESYKARQEGKTEFDFSDVVQKVRDAIGPFHPFGRRVFPDFDEDYRETVAPEGTIRVLHVIYGGKK